MRKQFFLIVTCLVVWQGLAAAIPAQITYQGTLKTKGVPASGLTHMHFAITNADGTQQYGNAVDTYTMVAQGLFSVPLTFTGVDWENLTPYIQVTVENVVIGPPEAVTATVYATIASSVIDGSITNTKLGDASVTQQKMEPTSFQAAGVGLVPVGAIMMFDAACPLGWTRFTALDNTFPMGSSVYGVTGGSATHTHVIDPDGAHTHQTASIPLLSGAVENGPTCFQTAACPNWDPQYPGQTTTSAGMHNHGGFTHAASSLPPYLGVVFCQKQ